MSRVMRRLLTSPSQSLSAAVAPDVWQSLHSSLSPLKNIRRHKLSRSLSTSIKAGNMAAARIATTVSGEGDIGRARDV